MISQRIAMHRVVITGIGMVTALGGDLPTVWRRLLAGENGIGPIRSFDASEYPCKVAAEVMSLDGSTQSERDGYRDNYRTESGLSSIPGKYCRCGVQLFLKAAKEAYSDSGLDHFDMNPNSIGVATGGSVAYIDHDQVLEHFRLRDEDGNKLDLRRFAESGRQLEYSFWRRVGDTIAAVPAKVLHLAGPTMVTDTACAASAHAIGEAFRLIRRGKVQAMLAGGASALVAPIGILYFAILGALSRNPDPEQASRPFDRRRDGFVMGEGGGAVVLEDEDLRRGRARDREVQVAVRVEVGRDDGRERSGGYGHGRRGAEVARAAQGLAEGDRVAVNPIQSCNACNSCRAGKPQFCQNLSVLGVTT